MDISKYKILIVGASGAGKVSNSEINAIIAATGHLADEVIIIDDILDNKNNIDNIISMRNNAVAQHLDILNIDTVVQHLDIDTIAYLPRIKVNYNINKQNSQQGWKNRPKHRR